MIARMTNPEREAFLAEPRVAVIGIAAPDRAPVTVPIWYHYVAGGEVGLWLDGSSYKVRLLRETRALSLCVHHAERPYRYVSVEPRSGS